MAFVMVIPRLSRLGWTEIPTGFGTAVDGLTDTETMLAAEDAVARDTVIAALTGSPCWSGLPVAGEAIGQSVAMALESAAYAAVFGALVGWLTALVLTGPRALSMGGGVAALGLPTQLVISLGAGLYEELAFRVLLVGALLRLFTLLLPAGRRVGTVLAVVLSALAPLYGSPDHRAELTSEAPLGHVLEVLEERAPFLRLRGEDGHAGWVHRGHVSTAAAVVGPWREDAHASSLGAVLNHRRSVATRDTPMSLWCIHTAPRLASSAEHVACFEWAGDMPATASTPRQKYSECTSRRSTTVP